MRREMDLSAIQSLVESGPMQSATTVCVRLPLVWSSKKWAAMASTSATASRSEDAMIGTTATALRLNLGACDRRIDGFISVDICEPADQIVDLAKQRIRIEPDGSFQIYYDPWPWPDSSVDEVLAFDVFEHLPSKRHTMGELWRILRPGGRATIQVPHATDGDGGECDPTHCSRWTTSDFEYYCPGIPERERFRNSPYYGIKADFKVVSIGQTRHKRRFGGYVMEIQAVLEAVK